MIFPAIRDAIKEFRQSFGSDLVTLGLKESGAIGADWYSRNGFSKLAALHGEGSSSWSGESVTEQKALNHSVWYACVRIISESLAFMPLQMMQEVRGEKAPAKDHPMYRALHDAPNDEMTAMGFRETETAHCVQLGNLYAKIERRSGTGVAFELYPLQPSDVMVDRDKQMRLVYAVKESPWKSITFTVERGKPHDILHVRGLGNDGIRGYSVVAMARQSLGTAMSQAKYAGRYFATGARQPGHIEVAAGCKFRTDEDFQKFRDSMSEFFNADRLHEMPIFEPGMTFKPYAWSPQDSQFIESQQFSIPEICRWFLISPHMVGDLSRATFSNIEHLALQFVKMTLTAWMTRWEQELWRCVLTPSEKNQGYYFKHNANGLLRGDFSSRMAGYASALQNGHLVINEVRDLEDRNPIEGGDYAHIQLNMQTLPGGTPTEAQQAAQQNALVRVGRSVRK